MDKTLLEQARKWRDLVLLVELAGWLHDLGKLSQTFVESHLDPAYNLPGDAVAAPPEDAEDEDGAQEPEDWKHHEVFPHDEEAGTLNEPLAEVLKKSLGEHLIAGGSLAAKESTSLGIERAGLWDLVFGHHRASWGELEPIQRLLVRADGHDSGEDEYSAVANQRGRAHSATVFGLETPLAGGDLAALDRERAALYAKLPSRLAEAMWNDRPALWELLQGALRWGLGKSQRAANDVRLDQHAWGVAARLKAFALRDLIDPPAGDQPRPTFRLLTLWWDWWALVTPFARLSDVVGRVVMLDRLRGSFRSLIEEQYAVGSRVYEDGEGVHFMVADQDWKPELEPLIREVANHITGGEVQPVILQSEGTQYVTDLVGQLDRARKDVPPVGQPEWAAAWASSRDREVCPVCQRRPLEGGRELCSWCAERRREGIEQRRTGEGTLWTGEIADDSGRVALIVARFGLERWLDGTMLHTVFSTSPHDMARQYADMRDVIDWRHLHAGVRKWLEGGSLDSVRTYRTAMQNARKRLQRSGQPNIPEERRPILREEAEAQIEEAASGFWAALIAGEMDRHHGGKGRRIRSMASDLEASHSREDALLLALARKNPSASRLLRVWETTETFLRERMEAVKERAPERQRVLLTLRDPPRPGIYTAELPALGRQEIYVRREGGVAQTITGLREGELQALSRAQGEVRLISGEHGGSVPEPHTRLIDGARTEPYRPYQEIVVSPNLLLAMVPADQALEIAGDMQRAYAREFGKVQGRLPFHVGLIYMDAHYPMFAALDTARRLAETFDQLARAPAAAALSAKTEEDGAYELTLGGERYGTWTWRVPALLGDDEYGRSFREAGGLDEIVDWYHPYFLVTEGEGLDGRGMSLAGPGGRWVHVSELHVGDQITFHPSLFDFIFLDTASRRLDARIAPGKDRRPHALLGGRWSTRPYLLERVSDLVETWEAVCALPGISETRLAAVESLLSRKWREWQLSDPESADRPANWASFRWLVQQVVSRDLGGSKRLKRSILEGSFYDVIELYRHILKQSLPGEDASPGSNEEDDP